MTALKRKPRRGLARVVVHIALFALIGIVAVGLSVYGNALLKRATEEARVPARVDALHKEIETLLKAEMHATTDDKKLQSQMTNGFSAKRKSVKNAIDERVRAGADDAEIILFAIDAYTDGVSAKLGEGEALAAVTARVEGAREALCERVARAVEAAADGISAQSVRMSMSVSTTENYAVMYYHTALLWIGAALLALAAILTALWFSRDEDGRARLGAAIEPFDYLLPFFVGVAIFTVYPMARVAVMSFQEKYKLGKNAVGEFVKWGLGNYRFVLFGVEGTTNVFMRGLRNTAIYVALTVPISAAISILMAYLLNQKIRLNGLFQTAYFIPMVTTATAVGLVWRWMFNENFGLINALIQFISPASQPINWLQSSNHAVSMAVLVIYGVWSSLPFTIILLLSGLQNIDDHLYTVAKVDGSGAARIFFRITVPLLSPTIGLVLIINSISAFKVYTDVVVLWNGSPEGYAMETVAWYIYNNITNSDGTHSLGYAAAAAMVLFVIIFIFTMIQKVIQRKWVYQ